MQEKKNMKSAVIYARYSSDKQTEDSIAAQRRACMAYAAAHGLSIVGEYVDEAVSGKGAKTASRKQYQDMLRDCDKGMFNIILIHKYDRVARSLGEHVNLEKRLQDKGITLIATAQDFGQTNESKIMKALMWAMSEYYSDNLGDEVKKGHRETALKGLHNGGYAPFGYEVSEQTYAINDLEAGYVRKIFHAAANREGFTAIVEELDAAGVRGKRGKPIKYTQIYEMLKNEKYCGTYLYSPQMEGTRADRRAKPNAIRIENAFPAIIDKPLFERVRMIMNERKQTGKRSGYLCSGLVYCSCGAKMHVTRSKKGNFERAYYWCTAKCGGPGIRVDDVDEVATRYLRELLTPANQQKISDAMRKYSAGETSRADEFNKAVKKEMNSKQAQYDKYLDRLGNEDMPSEVVSSISHKMKALKDEMEALREVKPPADYTSDQIIVWLEALKESSDEKAIHLLIERINVIEKKRFLILSTLNSILGETGRGDWI